MQTACASGHSPGADREHAEAGCPGGTGPPADCILGVHCSHEVVHHHKLRLHARCLSEVQETQFPLLQIQGCRCRQTQQSDQRCLPELIMQA